MNTANNLKAAYDNGLKQQLSQFEKQRKIVLLWSISPAMALLLATIIAIGVITALERDILAKENAGPYVILIFVVFFSFFSLIGVGRKKREKYAAKYKKSIVAPIIKTLNPDWMYIDDSCISENDYDRSMLYSIKPEIYKGDDLVMGTVGQTGFESSELLTQYTTESTDDDGDTHTQFHTIFKGYFFQSVFNKSFKGHTVVVHGDLLDKADAFKGFTRSKKGKQQFVKLENPEFTGLFTVQSTDQIESRYILTPRMMEALINIQKKYKRPMRVAFINEMVYLTIQFSKDLFEPKVWRSGVKFETVQEIWDLFMLNADIIRELDLNSQLWT